MKELLLFTQSQALIDHWIESIDDSYIQVSQEEELYKAFDSSKDQIILCDLQSFPDISLLMLKAKAAAISLFALTGNPTFKEGFALLSLGISGFGNAYMAAGNLKIALEVVREAKVWLYPDFIQELIAQATVPTVEKTPQSSLAVLTPKELEVAHCVAQGMSNKEVAGKLAITERTTKAHLTHIYDKLNISDRLSLALMLKAS